MHTLELPADADRATVYAELLASIRALVDDEPDLVANLANIAAAIKQALPKEPTEADLAPAFAPETGEVSKAFAESCALTLAIFAFERRWLEGLIEAATR